MRNRHLVWTSLVAIGLTACATPGGMGAAKVTLDAAIADPARPDADRQRDADRKPAEMIAFAGIHAGSKVSELLPGGGYFTRIFSKVVGPTGKVYALVPPRPANAPAGMPDFAAPMNALAADTRYGNISVQSFDPAAKSPELVDLVWTSLNYHDLHNRPNPDLMPYNKMVFNALKPGGVYIVVDHVAEAGSGARDTSIFHRIDPALVKTEVTAAGFEFVGESNALRNPADPHNVSLRDPSIRGKTDQFVYKFRKPAR
jgi:predicted methyltransferase